MPGTKEQKQKTIRIGRFLTTTVEEALPCKLETSPPPVTNSRLIAALTKTESIEVAQEAKEETVMELEPAPRDIDFKGPETSLVIL